MAKIIDNKETLAKNVRNYLIENEAVSDNKALINLYKKYFTLIELQKENKEILNDYENQIYNINGNILSDRERINVEIDKIEKIINNNNGNINDDVEENLKHIRNLTKYDDVDFDGYIPYIKRLLCYMQAMLGIDITFYNDAIDAFETMYNEKIDPKAIKEAIRKDKVNR